MEGEIGAELPYHLPTLGSTLEIEENDTFNSTRREYSSSVDNFANGERAPLAIRTWWLPDRAFKQSGEAFSATGQEISLGFPLRIESDSLWLVLASLERWELDTAAVLPDSGLALPNQLWDPELGTMYFRDLAGGQRVGGMVRVGSPSDRPFSELRDMTATLLGFWTIPRGERDEWSLSLFYSPTGQIIYPLPGVAYVWRPHDHLRLELGIPFSVTYEPTDTLTLSARYRPLTDGQAFFYQRLGTAWTMYGGYRTVNETFWLADRQDDDQRLYLFDQRVTLGLRRTLGRGWNVDVSTSYVFDRMLFQARKFSGDRRDELTIDAGIGAGVQLFWLR